MLSFRGGAVLRATCGIRFIGFYGCRRLFRKHREPSRDPQSWVRGYACPHQNPNKSAGGGGGSSSMSRAAACRPPSRTKHSGTALTAGQRHPPRQSARTCPGRGRVRTPLVLGHTRERVPKRQERLTIRAGSAQTDPPTSLPPGVRRARAHGTGSEGGTDNARRAPPLHDKEKRLSATQPHSPARTRATRWEPSRHTTTRCSPEVGPGGGAGRHHARVLARLGEVPGREGRER